MSIHDPPPTADSDPTRTDGGPTHTDDPSGAGRTPDIATAGPYRLLEKIGEGGMGTVYQAVHVHLAKHVALKILPSDKLRSKQSVARFRQEMRAVGQVNHPNVVSASDAGTVDGQHFLVMELVEGEDLSERIGRGALDLEEALESDSDLLLVDIREPYEYDAMHIADFA